ncbi:MAG: DUF885 domain-containing protein [Thermoflexibacter sp.]|nr:DUF885 domain-containing protein [Thermoflexibacter sp.]
MRFYTKYFLWIVILLPTIWLVNTIWYKPFDIDDFYERLLIEYGLDLPEEMTRFGFWEDYGISFYNNELNNVSAEKAQQRYHRLEKDFEMLRSYKRSQQTTAQLISTDVLDWFLENEVHEHLLYKDYSYPLNHIKGAHIELPFFMVSEHKITSYSEARDYIYRLAKFSKYFEQISARIKAQEDSVLSMPNFVIDNLLTQLSNFTKVKSQQNILYTEFMKKIDKLPNINGKIKGELGSEVKAQIDNSVYPAYQQMIRMLDEIKESRLVEDTDVGIWRFQDGEGYYSFMLRKYTNADFSPEEMHQSGLEEVANITQKMRSVLDELQYPATLSISDCIKEIAQDTAFSYENKENERLQKDIRTLIKELDTNLSYIFETKPKTVLRVQFAPLFKEKYLPSITYQNSALDEKPLAFVYLNMSKKQQWRAFENRALVCRDIVLGKHIPISIQREAKTLPTFRRILYFDAFNEGWAHYSLELANEYGYFKSLHDRLGMYHLSLASAIAMVIDTGIHFKKWTRDQAIAYAITHSGLSYEQVLYMVDGVIMYPAKSCAYYTGYQQIKSLRKKAQETLKEKFNAKDFHEVLLQNGAVPLDILTKIIDTYIEKVQNEGV